MHPLLDIAKLNYGGIFSTTRHSVVDRGEHSRLQPSIQPTLDILAAEAKWLRPRLPAPSHNLVSDSVADLDA